MSSSADNLQSNSARSPLDACEPKKGVDQVAIESARAYNVSSDGDIARMQSIRGEPLDNPETPQFRAMKYQTIPPLIQQLLPELLSEIFTFSLPDDWEHQIYAFRRAVMLPGSISRHWRDIALTTPRLWSFMGRL